MLTKLSNTLRRWAKGWLVFILFLLDAAFIGLILPIGEALMTGGGSGPGPLDLRFFTLPATSFEIVALYGKYNRIFYRNFELTIDIIYPIVYTLFFSLLITWLFQKGFASESKMQRLNVIPFGAWLFDLLENLGIVTLLSTYPIRLGIAAWLTTFFTMVKWLFAGASLILVIVGIFAAIRNIFKKK